MTLIFIVSASGFTKLGYGESGGEVNITLIAVFLSCVEHYAVFKY